MAGHLLKATAYVIYCKTEIETGHHSGDPLGYCLCDNKTIPFCVIIATGGSLKSKGIIMNYQYQKFDLQHISSIKPVIGGVWRSKNILPTKGVAIIYGPPGVGKSFTALHLALAIAMGKSVAGQKTIGCGTLYIAAEAGEGIKNRIHAAKTCLDVTVDAPFSLITAAPNLGQSEDDALELLAAIQQDEDLNQIKYQVVIIDTLARVISGCDENSSRDAGLFIRNAEFLSRELNALIIVVHHSGKNEDSGMRGSSALLGAADAVFKISKRSDYLWFQIEKQREGSSNLGFSFKLKPVDVCLDSDGEKITTCIIDEVSNLQPSDAKSLEQKNNKNYRQCLSELQRLLKSNGKEISLPDDGIVKAVEKSVFYSFYQNTAASNVANETSRKRLDRFLKQAQNKQDVGLSWFDSKDFIWLKE